MKRLVVAMCITLMAVSLVAIVGCLDDAGQETETGIPEAIEEAGSASCQTNQQLIENAIDVFSNTEGEDPKNLQDLVNAGLLKSVPTCPEGGSYRFIKGNPPSVECTIKEHNVD